MRILNSAGSCPWWQEEAYKRSKEEITPECVTQHQDLLGTEKKKCDFKKKKKVLK